MPTTEGVGHVRSAFPRCLTARRLDHCTGRAFPAGGHPVDFHQALRSERARLLDLRFNQRLLKQIEVLRVPVIGIANGLAIVVLRIATSDRSNLATGLGFSVLSRGASDEGLERGRR
jgi:hypothetical protein